MTDYATVPHYFLPPSGATLATIPTDPCDAPGCGKLIRDDIHDVPEGQDAPMGAAAAEPEFGDVG